MDNQNPKPPMSDGKKYGLLAIAAFLLIGAFAVGRFVDINPTYDHTIDNSAVASEIKNDLPKAEIVDSNSELLKKLPSDDVMGDLSDNPTVTLIEYGSLTCPHCAEFHQNALSAIKQDYINSAKIQYIYRDYPLDGAALKASLLARCDSSKRAVFLDVLYKKQMQWASGKTLEEIEKNLTTIGRTGGLSAEKIKECLADKNNIESLLSLQKQSSEAFSISATPTILINNQKFAGGLDANKLKVLLDHLLKKEEKVSQE